MKILITFYRIFFAAIVFAESVPPSSIREERKSYDILSSSLKVEQTLSSPSEISKYVNLGLGSQREEEEEEEEEEEDVAENGEKDIPRESSSSRRDRLVDREVADQLEGNGWLDVIPGTPGKDYPNYQNIPQTSFTCDEKTAGGYYADIEARCQVFHVCNTNGEKSSFMCPSGSIFNQKYFVCDWWYDFECDDATDLYSLNEKINRGGTGSGPSGPGRLLSDDEQFNVSTLGGENFVPDGFDLSLAGTGEGNIAYGRNADGYQSNVNRKRSKTDNPNNNNNNNNRRQKSTKGKSFKDENEKSAALITGEKKGEQEKQEQEEEQERRSAEFARNWGRNGSFRKEGNIEGGNRGVGNYEGREVKWEGEGEGEEGKDNFRTGNDRRRDREPGYSTSGFKKEFLERRVGVNDERNNDGDGDGDGGGVADNPSGEYRGSSISQATRNGGVESIVRGSHLRIKDNRNAFRGNNYSKGDYLLGIVMDDRDRENRSSTFYNPMQRRRFLPIL